MRRYVGLHVLVALLAGVIAAAGCGTTQKGITTPEGQVQYNSSKNEVTVSNSKGEEKTWTVKSASEAALGIKVPSNAVVEKGSVAVISSTSGAEKWSGATFWSDDDVATVIAFYKDTLSGMTGYMDTSTTSNGVQIGLFSVKSGSDVKSVVIGAGQSSDPGKTKIVIATAASAESSK
jgi:hypothetical protein